MPAEVPDSGEGEAKFSYPADELITSVPKSEAPYPNRQPTEFYTDPDTTIPSSELPGRVEQPKFTPNQLVRVPQGEGYGNWRVAEQMENGDVVLTRDVPGSPDRANIKRVPAAELLGWQRVVDAQTPDNKPSRWFRRKKD